MGIKQQNRSIWIEEIDMKKLTKSKDNDAQYIKDNFPNVSYRAEFDGLELINLETDNKDLQNWAKTKGLE